MRVSGAVSTTLVPTKCLLASPRADRACSCLPSSSLLYQTLARWRGLVHIHSHSLVWTMWQCPPGFHIPSPLTHLANMYVDNIFPLYATCFFHFVYFVIVVKGFGGWRFQTTPMLLVSTGVFCQLRMRIYEADQAGLTLIHTQQCHWQRCKKWRPTSVSLCYFPSVLLSSGLCICATHKIWLHRHLEAHAREIVPPCCFSWFAKSATFHHQNIHVCVYE